MHRTYVNDFFFHRFKFSFISNSRHSRIKPVPRGFSNKTYFIFDDRMEL